MSTKTTFVSLIILLVVGSILYWQYTFYRSPTISTGETEIIKVGELQESDGIKHSIPLDDIVSGGPPEDGIPSINDPKFESVMAADQYLDDDGFGLDVEVRGKHRFYPFQILVWHEIVNDTFNGRPLIVTYCPLSPTGKVFERQIEGEIYEFGTSGKLYNSNLIMYDRRTDSFWSQGLGEAIVGELTGTKLESYPSLTISWREFKQNYPAGEVLSRKTGVDRDYTHDPYGSYYSNNAVLFPVSNKDGRLDSKELVFGFDTLTAQKAFPSMDVKEAVVINDEVGSAKVLVFWDDKLETVRGYNRIVGEQTLTFKQGDDFLMDNETGSLWNNDGEAVSGELRGQKLGVLVLENRFWFSWVAFHPETDLFTK